VLGTPRRYRVVPQIKCRVTPQHHQLQCCGVHFTHHTSGHALPPTACTTTTTCLESRFPTTSERTDTRAITTPYRRPTCIGWQAKASSFRTGECLPRNTSHNAPHCHTSWCRTASEFARDHSGVGLGIAGPVILLDVCLHAYMHASDQPHLLCTRDIVHASGQPRLVPMVCG
jgi:hypothetical protein